MLHFYLELFLQGNFESIFGGASKGN